MDGVYYTDEVYRAHDGIRDRFDWARFSNPRFVTTGLILVLALVVVAGQDRTARVRGRAVEVGAHVAAESVRTAAAVAGAPGSTTGVSAE